ncbi:SH3 domain-containing protein [Nitratifractor sp.]
MKILWHVLLLTALLGAWEYRLVPGKRPRSVIDRLPFHTVRDMRTIPQNPAYYARQLDPIPRSRQLRYDREYNRRYFAPWSQTRLLEPENERLWMLRFVARKVLYDAKGHRIPASLIRRWIADSAWDRADTLRAHAISVRPTNLRAFPTRHPAYRDPWKNTEGFPFDYFQHSELHVNVPLYVSHYSRDRKWAYVEAAHAAGWVPVRDIALVDRDFMRRFRTGRYYVTIRDDLWLLRGKRRVGLIKLSTIFPLAKDRNALLVAVRDRHGKARIGRMRLPSPRLAAPKPLAFTPRNVAAIAKEFYGEPYGWGGVKQTRDCSATTRDFFGVFGIFLKRNSAKQAQEGRSVVSIRSLKGKKKKEAILRYAKPFRSLLYVPGHIALYLGCWHDEPVIMHTYWGVRLKNWNKYPLCRTIITTTEPGKELPDLRRESMMSNTLQKIVTF